MTIQCTQFFVESVGAIEYGWTETHYLIGVTDLVQGLNTFRALASDRAALCGAGVVCPYLRVSQPDVFRDSQIFQGVQPKLTLLIPQQGQGVPNIQPIVISGKPTGDTTITIPPDGLPINSTKLPMNVPIVDYEDLIADQPEVGLLVRLEAASAFTTRRSLLLRGIPDGITFTNISAPQAAVSLLSRNWLSLFALFSADLVNGSWGMRAYDPTVLPVPVSAWTVAGANPTVVTALMPPSFAPTVGQKVRISGVRVVQPNLTTKNYSESLVVAGITPVTSGSPPTTVGQQITFYSAKANSSFMNSSALATNVVAKGTVRMLNNVYVPYTRVISRRWASRKAGIPFDQQHSRRRRRA